MKLEGTKTEINLLTAFAGESQARNRYTFDASIAKKEGYTLILRREQTILVSQPMDITKQVLEALNAVLASVAVAEPTK